jgi:type III secretory pathway component EscT
VIDIERMPLPSATEIEAIGLAWARVSPTIAIVPAFGLRALPTAARGVLGLALAAAIYPALVPVASEAHGPWVLLALGEVLRGLPIAIAAAIPLWAATMAGGLVDTLRGAQEGPGMAVVEGRAASFGVLLSLVASVVFLGTGGPSRVVSAIATASLDANPLLALATALVAGLGLAVAIAAPLLAAAVVLELAFALVARAATPAQVHALLAPLRALGLVAVVAVVLERLAAFMAMAIR